MAALTKAVYDSTATQEDTADEPRVARLLPGGATVAALIIVIVLIAGVSVWKHARLADHARATERSTSEQSREAQSGAETPAPAATSAPGDRGEVIVYVSGAVGAPGVLTLPTSSRVIDAINAAGGALPEADLDAINLARVLVDGEHIRVAPAGQTPTEAGGNTTDARAGGCVRLDTASATDLQTLPGIGPALAARIIEYRSTHPHIASVEALDEVPGIGPSLIEKIRPGVCP